MLNFILKFCAISLCIYICFFGAGKRLLKNLSKNKLDDINVELHYPNEDIFKKYGSLNDDNSLLSRSQVLMIRHGISDFNLKHRKFMTEFDEKYPGNSPENIELKKKAIVDRNSDVDESIIDSLLADPAGHDQALQ